MDASDYTSRQEVITRRAKEKGIALEVLNAVFDQKIEAVVHDYPGTHPTWRLGRAEYLVWEHFFPNEAFPGSPNLSDSGLSKMDKNIQKETDRYGSTYKRAMNKEWVHDMYGAHSPKRKENIGSRVPDYYDGPAKRRVKTDSYKPNPGTNGKHRYNSHDSYRPLSRDGKELCGYGTNKPTVYKSHIDYMVEKALAAGVSSDSYYKAYFRYGQKATEEKPAASAYWLLWRQEWMIWHKFFPGEEFVGAEPKLEPTTRDTEPSNFYVMDGSKLWSKIKSSPAYGRLAKESHLGKSPPAGPSSLPKKSMPLPAGPSTHGSRNNLQHQSQPVRTSNSTNRDQINFQPSQLIINQATAFRVSMETLVATYKEKRKLVKDHYPDQSQQWQRWCVEAIVWGQLFKEVAFPGREPRAPHQARDNTHTANPLLDGQKVFSYTHQEKAMETMAIKKGIRREFYQYLNTARHDAIAIHPHCTCYARNFFADRLTWHKFFKESFPFPWPHHDHSRGCGASVQTGPTSSPIDVVKAPSKSPAVKPEEREAIATVPRRTLVGGNVATLKAPPKSPIVKSEKPKAVASPNPGSTGAAKAPASHRSAASVSMQPQPLSGRPDVVQQSPNQHPVRRSPPTQLPTEDAHSQTAESRSASFSQNFASTRVPAPSSNPQCQKINTKLLPGDSYSQPLHGHESKGQTGSKEVSASPGPEFQEVAAPVSIMTALTQVRKNQPVIPDGAVVMQNMDSTICNRETVAHMFRCLQAEDAASITFISNSLKCHIRYQRSWNRDLLLWIETFTHGDTAAFSAGHLFLKGWVQRNLGFGVVQPYFYWTEIQNTASFKHAAPAPFRTSNAMSPMKANAEKTSLSAENLDTSPDYLDQAGDAMLVIRGDYVQNVPCSRAALKNLAFSFVIDSSKEKVEQRLRCTFFLNESKGPNKIDGQELDLVVKPLWATEKEEFEKATQFLRAWALRAFQSTPCKASTFLLCPEGLHILSKSLSALLANSVPGKPSGDPGKSPSPFNVSDLDLMLSEETAKAEGSSRLVLDEITGEVVSLRDLLKKSLYRASAKIFEGSSPGECHPGERASSAIVEDDNDIEDDDEVQVLGTDGQMKNVGGKFAVVKTRKRLEVTGFVTSKHKMEEGLTLGERAEKRVCLSNDRGFECKRDDEVVEREGSMGGVEQDGMAEPDISSLENGGREVEATAESLNENGKTERVEPRDRAEQNAIDEHAAYLFENTSRAEEASGLVNAKRAAEEVELGGGTNRDGFDESSATLLKNGPRGVETSVLVNNAKRKAEEVELNDRAKKKVCIEVVALEDEGR